jgi:putative endonuclease
LLERFLLAAGRSQLPQHLQIGERGELAALFYLRRQGFVIVARRWRTPKQRGDIDLIAWEGDALCFIEVKTRGSHEVASAESAVDEDKRKILRRMARQYMKGVDPPAESIRFDVLSVYLQPESREFTLFRAAFDW